MFQQRMTIFFNLIQKIPQTDIGVGNLLYICSANYKLIQKPLFIHT